MDERRLENFKSLTRAEVEDWCEGKTLEEIQEAMMRDNQHLRQALDIDDADLPRGRSQGMAGENAVEDVIVSRLDQIDAQRAAEAAKQHQREVQIAQAQNDAAGREVQRRFLERHPEVVPSPELGDRLLAEYLEIDPNATEWDDLTLEKAYSNLLVQNLES